MNKFALSYHLISPFGGLNEAFDPDCGEWLWQEFTRYVTVNYPSDGLLPQYTQELQDVVAGNSYKVSGANHTEVRNMSNSPQGDITKQRFDEIFDKTDWFETN